MRKPLFFVLSICSWIAKPVYGHEQDILIFYHIPKTGGMSVSSVIDAQFSPATICKYGYYYEIEDKQIEELSKSRFIRGHFFFQSPLSDIKYGKAITFLRDPIERVLSEQRYLEQYYINNPEIVYQNHYLLPGNPTETVSNQYCRFLSGYDRCDMTITDAIHLAKAKYNLENIFFFVGLTEKMEASIWVLHTLMGWEMPKNIPRHNTTRKDRQLEDPALIESIRQRNWADIELYEFAKVLFESRYTQLNSKFGRQDA